MWPFNKREQTEFLIMNDQSTTDEMFIGAIRKVRERFGEKNYIIFESSVKFSGGNQIKSSLRIYFGDYIAQSLEFKSVGDFVRNVDKVLGFIDIHKEGWK